MTGLTVRLKPSAQLTRFVAEAPVSVNELVGLSISVPAVSNWWPRILRSLPASKMLPPAESMPTPPLPPSNFAESAVMDIGPPAPTLTPPASDRVRFVPVLS